MNYNIKYHNECEQCGKLFWTSDAFNTICLTCKYKNSKLFQAINKFMRKKPIKTDKEYLHN